MSEPTPIIEIEYWAEKFAGGFRPVYTNNGRERGGYGRGYDEDEALRQARAMANSEAAHYAGDWDVRVSRRF